MFGDRATDTEERNDDPVVVIHNIFTPKGTSILVSTYFTPTLQYPLLLDTGASTSLLSRNLLDTLPNIIPVENAPRIIFRDHQGREIPQYGFPHQLTFRLGTHWFSHVFYVTDDQDNFIAGLDFLMTNNCVLTMTQDCVQLTIGPPGQQPQVIATSMGADSVRTVDYTILPPGTISTVKVSLETPNLGYDEEFEIGGIPAPPDTEKEFYIIDTLQRRTLNNLYKIPILNHTELDLEIPAGQTIAKTVRFPVGTVIATEQEMKTVDAKMCRVTYRKCAEASWDDDEGPTQDINMARTGRKVDDEPAGYDIHAAPLPPVDAEKILMGDPHFPDRLVPRFVKFLREEAPDVISRGEFDFGTLKLPIEMDIDLLSNVPVTSKPYNLNSIRQEQLQKAVARLVDAGLLVPGDSSYTSPAFIIQKKADKDGSRLMRLIFDYRELNKITKKKHFPLPLIKGLLASIAHKYYYTNVDLRSAYHNLKLSPSAQEKAAVIIAGQILRPTRCVFGLTGAPSAFQEVMHRVLVNVEFTHCYLDDIIVATPETQDSELEHLRHLERLFLRLQEVGMKIHLGKCEFFRKKIKFLGKILSRDGIMPLPSHVEAIKDFPSPNNVTQLQRFNGLINFLSNFIYDYSKLMNPLFKALQGKEFKWTEVEEKAFKEVKKAVIENAITYHPVYHAPMYLSSDACAESHAAILYQVVTYKEEDLPTLQANRENPDILDELAQKQYHPVFPTKGGARVPKVLDLTGTQEREDEPIIIVPQPIKDKLRSIDSSEAWKENLENPSPVEENCNVDQIHKRTRGTVLKDFNLNYIAPIPGCVHVVRVVAYYSGVFRGPALNYTILEKESIALIRALENFRDELHAAAQTYVVSDSQAFLFLLRYRNLGLSRVERLCVRLLQVEYRIIIGFMKGEYMASDALTRVYKVDDSEEKQRKAAPNYKKAVVVASPFRHGQIVTVADVIYALEKCPNLVQIPPRSSEPVDLQQEELRLDRAEQVLAVTSEKCPQIPTAFPPLQELNEQLAPENLIKEQRADPKWAPLIKILHTPRESRSNSEETSVEGFILDKGILKKEAQEQTPRRTLDRMYKEACEDELTEEEISPLYRIVVPKTLVPSLLAYFHYSAHSGAQTLEKQIRVDYYVPDLQKQAQRFTRACHLCSTYKQSPMAAVELGVIPLPLRKGIEWNIDLVTGLVKIGGYDAYMSICDRYANFRLAIPVSTSINARQIAELVEKHILQPYGLIDTLISDGEPRMTASKPMRALAKFYGFKVTQGTPYAPKAHAIEPVHKHITTLMSILCDTFPEIPWPRLLNLAVLTLNSRPTKRLSYLSPYEVMLGKKSALWAPHDNSEDTILDLAQQKKVYKQIHAIVDELNRKQEFKRKECNKNAPGQEISYPPLSFCYQRIHDPTRKKPKMKQKYYPVPRQVLREWPQAVLLRDHWGVTTIAHKDNIRPCSPREAELFQNLPLKVKQAVGSPFSEEDLNEGFTKHEVPRFWKDLLQQQGYPATAFGVRTRNQEPEIADPLDLPEDILATQDPDPSILSTSKAIDLLDEIEEEDFESKLGTEKKSLIPDTTGKKDDKNNLSNQTRSSNSQTKRVRFE